MYMYYCGMRVSVLNSEVSFIQMVLNKGFHCTFKVFPFLNGSTVHVLVYMYMYVARVVVGDG